MEELSYGEYSYSIDSTRSFDFHVRNPDDEKVNNFVIYGDMGNANSQCLAAVEKRLATQTVDLIWHVGDIAYNMFEDKGNATDNWMNKKRFRTTQSRTQNQGPEYKLIIRSFPNPAQNVNFFRGRNHVPD